MKRRDLRLPMLLMLPIVAATATWMIDRVPDRTTPVVDADAPVLREPAYPGELHERFQQAAVMLHAQQYDYALDALAVVIELAPRMPEARANAGFALLGLQRPALAVRQFESAIALRDTQLNAYYGLAMACEALGDLDRALGAMRTYVHLAGEKDPHARRAWAAIWEWQARRDDARRAALRVNAGATAGGV